MVIAVKPKNLINEPPIKQQGIFNKNIYKFKRRTNSQGSGSGRGLQPKKYQTYLSPS
jgi:hypothetical protein